MTSPGRRDSSSARCRPRSTPGGGRLAERSAEPAQGCVAPDRQGAVGCGELRTPYLHQLPPVLPKNSFFSEFQMNFFQLPSSLAFPRAMVAGQRLPRGLRVGECGARPRVLPGCWLAAPARLSAGCTRRCRCGSPSARRALEGQRQELEEGEAAAGAEGGGRGRAGWAAPSPAPIGGRTAARGLSLVRHALLLPLGVWGSAKQLPLRLPLGPRARPPPPVTSAEVGRGRRKSERRTDKRTANGPTRTRLKRRNWRTARPTFTIYRAGEARGPAH